MIRSHAQKYFLKVQKNGTSEHVPPPRPKRKAAHAYPQKAPKNATVVPQIARPFQSSSALLNSGYPYRPDSSSMMNSSSLMIRNIYFFDSGHILIFMPDFAQVYSFIGSVFDLSASGHLQKQKQLGPINLETVLLLMRNLPVNLTSPEFEDHRRLLSTYDGVKLGCSYNTNHNHKSANAVPTA